MLLALFAITGQAKDVVWEQPTIEYGTSNGDGFFNLALDVTKVELKDNETVVYITALQRSDYPDFWFQFAGDTYLKIGEQRYIITSADGIELNKHFQTNKDYKQLKTFQFGYQDLYTDEQKSAYADLDEQGRFCVKIPVVNSTEFTIDWNRCFIHTMFEPSKTYFLLYDFKEGRRFFMGDDCRLQNELFRFPFDWKTIDMYEGLESTGKGGAELFEPYKGKFVLLDIWGTWCGPCKEALSHSTEEYARLKDYDIQYLYLANRSPQTAWENVIKEYNVSGPNVAHYNLPDAQQTAIERHLNVHSWPTYKLFNRNGDLMDLNVDPRNLEELARLLEQMK